eukprot:3312621-Prymnesium_polylepis.2
MALLTFVLLLSVLAAALQTKLLLAAHNGQLAQAESALRAGEAPDTRDSRNNWTPLLHFACNQGFQAHLEVAELLIAKGAAVGGAEQRKLDAAAPRSTRRSR